MSLNKFYNILNLQLGASEKDIKKAYHAQVLKYHPDKNSSIDAEQKFKDIKYAYKKILNEKKKEESIENDTFYFDNLDIFDTEMSDEEIQNIYKNYNKNFSWKDVSRK